MDNVALDDINWDVCRHVVVAFPVGIVLFRAKPYSAPFSSILKNSVSDLAARDRRTMFTGLPPIDKRNYQSLVID